MQITTFILAAFALSTTAQAAVIPSDSTSLSLRWSGTELIEPDAESRLEKRKGGGGGGRSSGSSSSSSSSGSSSSGGRTSSGTGGASTSSNTGGRTSSGSGVRPSYGNGAYYSGGAAVPYRSGSRSPGGVAPYFLAGSALGFAGVYAYGAYLYPYGHPYSFHNRSSTNNGTNTTLPVTCLCQEYQVCGCDNNTDSSYLSQLVGNGSASDMNATLARVADVNGTSTLLVNGSLPNGTTASGGTDSDSAAGSLTQSLTEASGWYAIAAGVAYTVWFM